DTHGFTNHRRVVGRSDLYCEHCERALSKNEGPRTPRGFGFSIQEIATALYDLASGGSYRGTARLRRRAIDRPVRSGLNRNVGFSNQPHLVQDWLEEFGETILEGMEAMSWPRVAVLDEKYFCIKRGCAN